MLMWTVQAERPWRLIQNKVAAYAVIALLVMLGAPPVCSETLLGITSPGPDFTAVYEVSCSYPLGRIPSGQIRSELINYYGVLDKQIAHDPSAFLINGQMPPPGYKTDATVISDELNRITRQFGGNGDPKRLVITLSQRGNKILVKTSNPDRHQDDVWVFDGVNTTFGRYGLSAEVRRGIWYSALPYFVFPGRSVGNVPLASNPVPARGAGRYTAAVVLNNGVATQNSSPQYISGWFDTASVGAVTYVTQLYAQDLDSSQTCIYSGYHVVVPGLVLPSAIRLELRKKLEQVPATQLPDTTLQLLNEQIVGVRTYTLLKASASAMPELSFTPEEQLPRAVIVQDFTHNPPLTVRHTPGKLLRDEISQQLAKSTAIEVPSGNSNSGAYGAFAVAAGLCAWYLYRRSATLKSGGN